MTLDDMKKRVEALESDQQTILAALAMLLNGTQLAASTDLERQLLNIERIQLRMGISPLSYRDNREDP